MDEHIETTEKPVNPYEGLNTLQPARFDFETFQQYRARTRMLNKALKNYSRGTMFWKSTQPDTKKGEGATFVKKDVEAYLAELKEKSEATKQEEDHIN
tara:strand:+ start:1220 stop:1513 length:294 start_codon:yes stop_codon:yes gene_type:complete